jgi:DNA transformation protein
MLAKAGIHNREQLQASGSVAAYLKTIHCTGKPNLNLLYALEGALTGEPWQEVARHDKLRLMIELDAATAHQSDIKKAE